MANFYYSLAPWRWVGGNSPYWAPPEGSPGGIDLAKADDFSNPGHDRPMGFFATPEKPGSEAVVLAGPGDLRELNADATMCEAWEHATGHKPQGDHLIDLLADHLMNGADPDGLAACPPLTPGLGGRLEICLPGHSRVWSAPFDRKSKHGKAVFRMHKDALGKLKKDARAGKCLSVDGVDLEFHRRNLDWLAGKYKCDWKELVYTAWPADEGPLPHHTTLTESFTYSDGSRINTWTGWSGYLDGSSSSLAFDVYSGQTRCGSSSGNCVGRKDSNLSGTDQYAQALYIAAIAYDYKIGTACRCQSNANCYSGYAGNSRWSIGKQSTEIAYAVGTITANKIIRLEVIGSTLTLFYDAAQKCQATDTTYSGGLKAGLYGYRNGGSAIFVDNWEAGDQAAPPTNAANVCGGTNDSTGPANHASCW